MAVGSASSSTTTTTTGSSSSSGTTGSGSSTGGIGTTGTSSGSGSIGTSGSSGTSGTPTPNLLCTGTATDDSAHPLTNCHVSVEKTTGSSNFTILLLGNDANNNSLSERFDLTDAPASTSYSLASTDYTSASATWGNLQTSTTYSAGGAPGNGVGAIDITLNNVQGPYTAGSVTYYTASGSISLSLLGPNATTASVTVSF